LRWAPFSQAWVIATHWAVTAVVGSWLALAISRRWRPERSWIDRAGRILGLYWAFLFVTQHVIRWLQAIEHLLAQGGLP
jgi:hypothetical protein